MSEYEGCGGEVEVGLTLVNETDVVKHYGQYCRDCYSVIDQAIEGAAFELRNNLEKSGDDDE